MEKECEHKQQLEAYLNSGSSYKQGGQFQLAIESFHEALKLAEGLKEEKKVNEVYLELGYAYESSDQIQLAIEYYKRALKIAEELEDQTQKTAAHIGLGEAYESNDQFQMAIEHFEKALKIANEGKNRAQETKAYLCLGYVYYTDNQFQSAIRYFEKGLEIAKEQEDKQQDILAYHGLGYACIFDNQIQTAIKYGEKVLEIGKERGNKQHETDAYLMLGFAYTLNNEIKKAILYYGKASEIVRDEENKKEETSACLELGDAYSGMNNQIETAKALQIAKTPEHTDQEMIYTIYIGLGRAYKVEKQYQTAIEYYNRALKIAKERGNTLNETEVLLELATAYRKNNQIKTAFRYYEKAMEIARKGGYEQHQEVARIAIKELSEVIDAVYDNFDGNQASNTCTSDDTHKLHDTQHQNADNVDHVDIESERLLILGHSFQTEGKIEDAIKSYEQAVQIAHRNEIKAKAYQHLGNVFTGTFEHMKAVEYYQKAHETSPGIEGNEMEVLAYQWLGYIHLINGQYKESMECYNEVVELALHEKPLESFGNNFNDHLLTEKALIGLGIAWFNLGDTQKGSESIRRARKLAKEETDRDHHNVDFTHQRKDSAKKMSSSQTSQVPGEWVNSVIEKACIPNGTEKLSTEDLVRLEKYIKEFPTSVVYTHHASSKDTLTEKVRKSMTRNVKSSAYESLLNPDSRDRFGRNNGKFVANDQQIFNFAKDDLSNNASTKITARLEPLCSYTKSIGQISCGRIRGTCWLVGDMLVVTNHHIYMMINTEKEEQQNPNLPITVTFDYLRPGQTEQVVTVDVDEEQDPKLENPRLDYKFLRLKECEGYQDRVPLGSIVRSRPLQEGRVIIVGYQGGKEMQEDTCVVVSNHLWREKRKQSQRHDKCMRSPMGDPVSVGLHMTNEDLLLSSEKYKGCLPYDTSLFSGASGSPVFDLNGNIVAMHTQGYTLNVEDGQCSLMEFGVQFNAICEDMRRRHIDVKEFFPNHNLDVDEQPMNQETEPKREEIHEEEKEIWFKDTFLDSKRKLKEEIHEELLSFPWLCEAYGLTAPTEKIARPHIYLTVKRGMSKSDVRRDLEYKFKCDAKEYFELLQEPKRKPIIKYLGQDLNKSSDESKATSSVSSVKAAAGGGVKACISNSSINSSPLRVPEENERDDLQGTGTLTMFCAHDKQHYALTCFHVGCATDEARLNATLNKKEDIQEIRNSLPNYVNHAKEKQYYFAERVVENNNEPISFGNDGSTDTPLGDFHNYHFDNKCDILTLKVSNGTEIDCKISGITSPNWENIWDEFYERVLGTNHDPVEVEKIGFSSGVTYGEIVSIDISIIERKESLYQDAIVVKGFRGPFLEDGDSGSLVFFHDKNNQKQVFAYGVCQLDELPALSKQPSVDDDGDGSSIWSGEDYFSEDEFESAEGEVKTRAVDKDEEGTEHKDKQGAEIENKIKCQKDDECVNEFENVNKRECDQDNECKVKCEEKDKYECDDENEYEDQNKSEDESEDNKYDDDTDFEVEFRDPEKSETNVSNAIGPYFICLRLDTALENLGLDKSACFSDCGSN